MRVAEGKKKNLEAGSELACCSPVVSSPSAVIRGFVAVVDEPLWFDCTEAGCRIKDKVTIPERSSDEGVMVRFPATWVREKEPKVRLPVVVLPCFSSLEVRTKWCGEAIPEATAEGGGCAEDDEDGDTQALASVAVLFWLLFMLSCS